MKISEMEITAVTITRMSELIAAVFKNYDDQDGLAKRLGISNKTLFFSFEKSFSELVSKAMDNNGISDEWIDAQHAINTALQIISFYLNTLFFRDQKDNRVRIEKLLRVEKLANNSITSAPINLLDSLRREKKEIAEKIESQKKVFDDLIKLAATLGFDVFDEHEYRYNWYLVLDTSMLELLRHLQLSKLSRGSQQ